MISDAGRATTCSRKLKAPGLHTKVQRTKDISKTWVLTGKQFERFRRKKRTKEILDLSKNPGGTPGP